MKKFPNFPISQFLYGLAILIISGIAFLFFYHPQKTEAAWWNESWGFRKSIQITNNAGAQSNVYVALTVDTSASTTQFQADCGDLRFTKFNGELLPYLIESGCGTATTSVLVAFDAFPAGQQTIFEYYGNRSADKGFASVQGGTVTQANMRLSIASSTAFVDFSAAGVLTANLGNRLVVVDSAGKKLWGYLKAAGVGETFGSLDLSNSSFDNLDGVYAQGPNMDDILEVDANGHTGNGLKTTIHSGEMYGGWQLITNNASDGSLYKYSCWAKQGTTDGIDMHTAYSNGTQPGQTTGWVYPSIWTQYTLYQTSALLDGQVKWNKLNWYIHDAAGKYAYFDDAYAAQVLTPSPTGATITSTQNGSNFDWKSEESGFNRNDAGNYAYRIYPQAFVTEAFNYSIGSFGAEERSAGPAGYWSFDEGQGTVVHDGTVNRNDGVVTGAGWKTGSECVSGGCLWFNGTNNYVEYRMSFAHRPKYLTISSWFKTGTSSLDQMIIAHEKLFWNSWHILITQGGQVDTHVGTSLASYTGPDARSPAGKSYADNKWHLVEATYDENAIKLYIDGEYVGQDSNDNGPIVYETDETNHYHVHIGSHIYGTGPNRERFTQGFIDEPKIYPYARSASQIKQDYAAGLAGMGNAQSGISATFGGSSNKWLTDGLVGYWKFDESATSSGAVDSSGNGNNGVYYGTASTTGGKFGNGGVFSGGYGYVDTNNSASLDVANAMTVSFWIKGNTTQINSYGPIMNKLDTSGWLVSVNGMGPNVMMRVDTSGGINQASGNISALDGTWHHIVWTLDNGAKKGYKDGVLIVDNTYNHGNGFGMSTKDLIINNPFSDGFNGSLDDIRFYNRALSLTEVKKLYEWAPGPVGWWKMDEQVRGGGKAILDSSGNGNNGVTNWGGNAAGMDCTVPGKFGSACGFDGVDDYAAIGDPANGSLDFGTYSFSYGMWVKPSANAGSYDTPWWKGGSSPGEAGYDIELGSGQWIAALSDGNNTFLNPFLNPGPLNTWTHIFAVIDRNTNLFTVYVNGMKQAYGMPIDVSTMGSVSTSIAAFISGQSDHSLPFKGSIDDIRIYNYARTQKQILEDMNGGANSRSPLQAPVAYYNFDEGFGSVFHNSGLGCTDALKCVSTQGVLNAGGGGGNTTVTQMWDMNGKNGKAVELDGTDDQADVSDDSRLDMSGDLSLNVWFKLSALPSGSGQYWTILRKNNNQAPWYSYWLHITSANKIELELFDSGSNWLGCLGKTALQAGVWYHAVAIRKDGVNQIYLNGKEDTDWSTNGSNPLFTTQPSVLRFGQIDGYYFKGLFDEVRIYNYALTADDIKADYNAGMTSSFGSAGTASSTGLATQAAGGEYCVPGSADYCAAPVGEWRMDEMSGATVNDTSGNGNDAAQSNPNFRPSWIPGKQGSALNFDGANDVIYASHKAYLSQAPFTAEAWVKFDVLPTAKGEIETVLDKKCSGDPWDGWEIFGDMSNQIDFMVANSSKVKSYLHSDVTITRGKWYHVVGTLDSSYNMSLFVNGLKQSVTHNPGSIYASDDVLYFGAELTGSNSLKGSVDNVKVYNYVRTPAQIAWAYNQGGPIAEWRLNECQGATLHDESGNGFNGVLSLGASGVTAAGTCSDNANTAWWNGRAGKYDGSLSFDGGSDYVSAVVNDGNFSNQISFSQWVKASSFVDMGGIISNFSDAGYDGGIKIIAHSNGKYEVGFRKTPGSYTNCTSNKVTQIGQWDNLTVAYDAGIVKIYINGILDKTCSGDTTITNVPYFKIGYNLDNNAYFNGQIDEVKIFNYALTGEQVKQLYNGSSVVEFR